jgi:hypothetical protein
MPFWRRDEPAHKKLGRALMNAQAGGFLAEPPDLMGQPTALGLPAIHGVARARRWDTVVSVKAPGLPGEAVHFVALADGTLIVDEDVPDDSLSPLADALEVQVEPPYRAEAVRRDETVWAVAADEIDVAEIDERVDGDVVELSISGGERTVLVDGEPAFGSLAAFEDLAEGQEAYVLRAERLDGNLWEVELSPL